MLKFISLKNKKKGFIDLAHQIGLYEIEKDKDQMEDDEWEDELNEEELVFVNEELEQTLK